MPLHSFTGSVWLRLTVNDSGGTVASYRMNDHSSWEFMPRGLGWLTQMDLENAQCRGQFSPNSARGSLEQCDLVNMTGHQRALTRALCMLPEVAWRAALVTEQWSPGSPPGIVRFSHVCTHGVFREHMLAQREAVGAARGPKAVQLAVQQAARSTAALMPAELPLDEEALRELIRGHRVEVECLLRTELTNTDAVASAAAAVEDALSFDSELDELAASSGLLKGRLFQAMLEELRELQDTATARIEEPNAQPVDDPTAADTVLPPPRTAQELFEHFSLPADLPLSVYARASAACDAQHDIGSLVCSHISCWLSLSPDNVACSCVEAQGTVVSVCPKSGCHTKSH